MRCILINCSWLRISVKPCWTKRDLLCPCIPFVPIPFRCFHVFNLGVDILTFSFRMDYSSTCNGRASNSNQSLRNSKISTILSSSFCYTATPLRKNRTESWINPIFYMYVTWKDTFIKASTSSWIEETLLAGGSTPKLSRNSPGPNLHPGIGVPFGQGESCFWEILK